MIIHLVRHGETAHNKGRLGLGLEDVPLTPFGELQAAAVGRHFESKPLDRIFCSPLQRAATVAGLLSGSSGAAPEPRRELLEMDIGETEGMEFPAMREKYPEFMRRWGMGDTAVRMPGGESIDDVAHRLRPFVEEVRQLGDESIAVVSHNFITKVLVCLFLDLPVAHYRSLAIDLASVTSISLAANGRSTLLVLNDTCHLSNLEQTVAEA